MEITQARVRELFDCQENGLLIGRPGFKGRKSGGLIGKLHKGYLQATVDHKTHFVHRLVFLWHHGYLPAEVDHIDGVKTNNKIDNLRPATRHENVRNRPAHRNNVSGYKGVTWDSRRSKWRADITVNYKQTFLGYFTAAELAHAAYAKAAKQAFGEFARTA